MKTFSWALLLLTFLFGVTVGQDINLDSQGDYCRFLTVGEVNWNHTDSNILVTGVVTNKSKNPYRDVLLKFHGADAAEFRVVTLDARLDYVPASGSAKFSLRGSTPDPIVSGKTLIVGGDPDSNSSGPY